MSYTEEDFRTKKELKEAVERGQQIEVHEITPWGSNLIKDGTVFLEGPHYPAPHSWYARALLRDGVIIKVS